MDVRTVWSGTFAEGGVRGASFWFAGEMKLADCLQTGGSRSTSLLPGLDVGQHTTILLLLDFIGKKYMNKSHVE